MSWNRRQATPKLSAITIRCDWKCQRNNDRFATEVVVSGYEHGQLGLTRTGCVLLLSTDTPTFCAYTEQLSLLPPDCGRYPSSTLEQTAEGKLPVGDPSSTVLRVWSTLNYPLLYLLLPLFLVFVGGFA
jgi:hypothetical protein